MDLRTLSSRQLCSLFKWADYSSKPGLLSRKEKRAKRFSSCPRHSVFSFKNASRFPNWRAVPVTDIFRLY